jgi:ABC-type Fe3+ transport system substrate-binding protein
MRWVVVLLTLVMVAIGVLGYFTLRESGAPASGPTPAKAETSAAEPPLKSLKLKALSPHPDTVQEEFTRAFSRWHQEKHGRPVEIVWGDLGGGASTILRYITTNFKATPDGIGLDIVWGGGFVPYQELARSGLLQPFQVPEGILAAMPSEVGGVATRDERFHWYGTALSGFGIIWNRERLARKGIAEPQTWADLASDRMLGEVGAADPRKSGSAYMAYEIVLQGLGWPEGWAVLARMAANARRFYQGAADVPKDVSLGEVSAGAAIDFYAWAQMHEDGSRRIGFVLPKGLTVINPDAIAVLKGAPNREAAFRFVEFVLSEEGQRLWCLRRGAPDGPTRTQLDRIPVRLDVYERLREQSDVRFDSEAVKGQFRFDPDVFAARNSALKDMYGAALIDVHPELVAAWTAIIRRGLKPAEVQAFCRPPETMDSLADLSARKWDDAAFRNAKMAAWSAEARRRYEALTKGNLP